MSVYLHQFLPPFQREDFSIWYSFVMTGVIGENEFHDKLILKIKKTNCGVDFLNPSWIFLVRHITLSNLFCIPAISRTKKSIKIATLKINVGAFI